MNHVSTAGKVQIEFGNFGHFTPSSHDIGSLKKAVGRAKGHCGALSHFVKLDLFGCAVDAQETRRPASGFHERSFAAQIHRDCWKLNEKKMSWMFWKQTIKEMDGACLQFLSSWGNRVPSTPFLSDPERFRMITPRTKSFFWGKLRTHVWANRSTRISQGKTIWDICPLTFVRTGRDSPPYSIMMIPCNDQWCWNFIYISCIRNQVLNLGVELILVLLK